MGNFELTIAVGAAILVYKSVRIAVWQKDLDSPFSFEFVLDPAFLALEIGPPKSPG
jgi:hypothetical protein